MNAPWVVRLWLLGVIVAGAGSLHAQGTTTTVRVNLPVTEPITRLHMSTATTDFGTVGPEELMAGLSQMDGPLIDVKANQPFVVMVAAGAATFGPASKPSADLSWAPSAGGPYAGLTTTGAQVLSAAGGAQVVQPLFFQMTWHLADDPPGAYDLELLITISAP
ncbi:MAG: hypothetical protein ABR551_07330 [Gemmatimonadales bacterium]